MTRRQDFLQMRRRLCTWDLEPKRADALKLQMERSLRFLPQLDLVRLKALDDPNLLPCDLLVVYAWHLGEEELTTWLSGFEKRLAQQQQGIWIPALIMSSLELSRVAEVLEHTLSSNWYFDLLHPDHLSSLPVRVANLLRMHDHLHEMLRYEKEIKRMQTDISRIEAELQALR
jgi:hypothetical protein